uniref:Sulfotransferase domain-containing protein n=1 Tax=Odontella aurita TaxID=265563 RepID=A0A6U6EAU1_9STRA|mmetsp:Transcript_25488/g.75084  ORF Transcript_25488/g.75084 Transcript_25488/m.75084 type:complete len:397 (+) Transcript_25488:307-1497(+)
MPCFYRPLFLLCVAAVTLILRANMDPPVMSMHAVIEQLSSRNSSIPAVLPSSLSIVDAWSPNSNAETGGFDWNDAKSCLCPNSSPRHSEFGLTLFKLARYEIGLNITGRNETDEEEFVRTFFLFPPKFSIFRDPMHGNASVIYVGDLKVASHQIRHSLRALGLREEELDLSSMKRKRTSPDACVITAVRDPVEHFLSGYSEHEYRTAMFAETRGLVDEMRVRYKSHRYGEPRRFEQLVEDFLADPGFFLFKKRSDELDYTKLLRHMWGQSRILTVLEGLGLNLTSYLPSIKNITEEWYEFVLESCPSAAERVLEFRRRHNRPMEISGQHESSKDLFHFRRAANAVWADRGPTARALCALHAIDYACFDRLPKGIHVLCAEVYSGGHFLDEIRKGCE